MLLVNVKLT